MESPSTAGTTGLEDYATLLEWLTSHGGHLHNSVQIAKDDRRGVHLQVKPDCIDGLPSNTTIIQTPVAATMSYYNAIEQRGPATEGADAEVLFPAHGLKFPTVFVDAVGPEETAIFFLIGQYLRGVEGFWYPYIRTLPQPGDLTTPLYYEGADLGWLEGTSLFAAREHRETLLKSRYQHGFGELCKTGFENADKYTWELYLWAATIFASRAFSAKVLAGLEPRVKLPDEHVSVLLPFIDISNHRPLAKVEWQAGENDVRFVVLEDVATGQEIANNYGPRNNEQLMMNYGFCLPDNPCDYRTLNLRAPPGSPLAEVKQRQKEEWPEREDVDHYYIFNIFYPLLTPDSALENVVFSPALLDAVSILAANARETEMIEMSQDEIKVGDCYGRSRLVLAALGQIIIELVTHVVKLKGSFSGGTPANLKQAHAKIYRDSQVALSRTALLVAAWTLNRARQHHARADDWQATRTLLGMHLCRLPQGLLPQETQERVRMRIHDRRSLVQHNGELFAPEDLYRLFPEEMANPCKAFLDAIIALEADGQIGPLPFVFPLMLCLVGAIYRTRPDTLSPRLKTWASFLLEVYVAPPPATEQLLGLPFEEEEELMMGLDQQLERLKADSRGQSVLSELEQFTGEWRSEDWWLSPNWVRWGWLIVQEETVQIPKDAMQLLSAGENGGGALTLETERYLYIAVDS